MDHTTPQDTLHSKSGKRPFDNNGPPNQDTKRPIRRVRSPSRPRAWLSHSNKPKFNGKFNNRDDHGVNKFGFNNNRYPHPKRKFYFNRREHQMNKRLAAASRDAAARNNKERYEGKKTGEERSPTKQSNDNRAFQFRSTSSRDNDKPFGSKSDKNQSRESDHRGSRSQEQERCRDEELQSTASQSAERDRAIQKKRKEIDEVYYQECEMFGLVVKMLISKDPSLEVPIQASLQQNLRDIGSRCVKAMEKFIAEYDSRKISQ